MTDLIFRSPHSIYLFCCIAVIVVLTFMWLLFIELIEVAMGQTQSVSQYAFLSVLLCTCGLVKRQTQPEYMFQFKVHFSQSTVKIPGCDLILPLSGGCIRGDLCGLWPADIPECISHQQPETIAEEKINY